MKQCNILFTSAGRRVSLLSYFKEALRDLGLSGTVVAADMNRLAPAFNVADRQELVQSVDSAGYIDQLVSICSKHGIQLLIPLIDTDLVLLATHRKKFESIGVRLLVSSLETNMLCSDKRETAKFFEKIGVRTPKIFEPEAILSDSNADYPFFLKPAAGSSSIGATRINSAKELLFFKNYVQDSIVQEFVTGDEYTMDVLVDFRGNIVTIVPRLRIETRAGETSKGMTVKNLNLIEAGGKVVASLPGSIGCITVQCFLTAQNEIIFTEINPRFGGGYPLAFQAGADFPRWLIQEVRDEPLPVSICDWRDGVLMVRYDEAFYTRQENITK